VGIDAAGFEQLVPSAALPINPTVQRAVWIEHTCRVFTLACLGIDWLTPKPLGSDREPRPTRINARRPDLRSRQRNCLLDQVACLPLPGGSGELSRRTERWNRLAAAALDFKS
jgi:hypothetical protein